MLTPLTGITHLICTFGFKTITVSAGKIHRGLPQFLQLLDWFVNSLRLRNKETTLELLKKIDRCLVSILFIKMNLRIGTGFRTKFNLSTFSNRIVAKLLRQGLQLPKARVASMLIYFLGSGRNRFRTVKITK